VGEPVRVVAFAGSLRRGSFNRALLHAAIELAPEGMTIELIEIRELPFYDADVEAGGDPPQVAAFKSSLQSAD
jgi:chromate reductase